MTQDAIRILLVEDNPADRILIERSAKKARITNRIDWVETGEDCLALLDQQAGELPDLILLDLHLPGIGGKEVLAAVRGHATPEVRRLPVVVLTSSAADADILRSYDLGANAFVTKPVGLKGFYEVVQAIDHFWFSLVRLPTRAGA